MNIKFKQLYLFFFIGLISTFVLTSCLDDLNQSDPNNTDTNDINNEEVCQAFLAKIYSGFGLSSNKGPSEENDLAPTGDQGSLVFMRGLITMQEYPADLAIWNWPDIGIVEITNMNWDYTTRYCYTFYQRAMLNIRFCKEFLEQYPENSSIRDIKQYRDEVRALRALNYYFLIDLFGNPALVWDDTSSDFNYKPSPIGKHALFDKIVAELEDLGQNSSLPSTPSMTTYGRMTKPVVWTILAKMYLNAEIYRGEAMYDKAAENCQKVINAGFGLESNYANLFCGENHLSPINGNEIIYAIICDADNAKSYGNTIIMTSGASGGALNASWLGMNGSWTCMKTRESLINKFNQAPDGGEDRYKSKTKKDKRYMFLDVLEYDKKEGIDDTWPFDAATGNILYDVKSRRKSESKIGDWSTGYLCYKFTNMGWDNKRTAITDFPNTDFPMFRLADIYLMYAECAIRGAGNKNTALDYINRLRDRAYRNDPSGRITFNDLTLDFIIDERARELYWEGHRRSDLIRFGLFTQQYVWPYKGGTAEGVANVPTKYNLYPFSDKDLTSNPNLVQNPGYKSVR